MKRFLIALLFSTITLIILEAVNIGLEEWFFWAIPDFMMGWFCCTVFVYTLEKNKLWN